VFEDQFLPIAGATSSEIRIRDVNDTGRYMCTAWVEDATTGAVSVSTFSVERNAEITPLEVNPAWQQLNWPEGFRNELRLTYNGGPQIPHVTTSAVVGNMSVTLTVASAYDAQSVINAADFVVRVTDRSNNDLEPYEFTNASLFTQANQLISNTGYRAHITSNNPNYRLSTTNINRLQMDYSIAPATVNVTWTGRQGVDSDEEFIYTYNGASQYPNPTATFVNFLGNTININAYIGVANLTPALFVGAQKENHAFAESLSTNFVVSAATRARIFEIAPAKIEVDWGVLQFVYDPVKARDEISARPEPQAIFINHAGNEVLVDVEVLVGNINQSGELTIVDAINIGKYTARVSPLGTANLANFVITNNQTEFSIIPLPVQVIWRKTEGATRDIEMVDRGDGTWEWTHDERPVFSNINYAQFVRAYIYIEATDTYTVAGFSAEHLSDGSTAFRNVGEYRLTAGLLGNQGNFNIEAATYREVYTVMLRATPNITVDGMGSNNTLHLVHRGVPLSLQVRVNCHGQIISEPPISLPFFIKKGGVVVSNSFDIPGFYEIEIYTEHGQNYFAASITILLYINQTQFASGSIGVNYESGALPGSTILLDYKQLSDLNGFRPSIARTIERIYKVSLDSIEGIIEINSGATVTMELPEELRGLTQVRILRSVDGVFREDIFEVTDGFVTFDLQENGYFAIATVNSLNVFIWWLIIGSAIALAVIIALAATKKKAYLVHKGRYIQKH
jgi:hypothetical protein